MANDFVPETNDGWIVNEIRAHSILRGENINRLLIRFESPRHTCTAESVCSLSLL